MAEDDIRLKDALIGIVAISAMDVLLVVTVFVMMKSGLAAGGLGTIMPAALALSVAVPTAALVYYLKHRGIGLGFLPLGRRGWHLLWQVPLVILAAGVAAAIVGPLLGISPSDNTSAADGRGVMVVVSLACYLLLAPLAEEIVFRRLLMGYLDRSVPAFASVILSSLLFGVAHIAPPVIVYATFLGMGCALVTRFHNSLRAGFIVHLVNNVVVQLIAVSAL
ncbi:CPBP family intramembrane metalloprotease [Corynebacterium kefirresidentii]|uniref:CPBP family intramembrane metalloprotease n=1 Tax=Corynebacterium kefirresidentii TaxID=1979527 RepID=A0ABT8Q335_9CORY|nr:CPBP family intramembrane glutamic endopeptidase [Corynebacterium kefirresidentii]MCG7449775.1 CPBP family intramembrane metalloprotease [Corynebacterium kefirresidentii]MCG7453360.1 CPBP family intramembrane metalloprotease [Corynebacterium kefirresidentii]MDK8837527.1 CPBP family intramembrane metalloprotease [Corynebacterium kefirresidentii]MDN8619638.1 CPBP family intramembrane metalloprotease [Corynebacterium kefirresidentii]MDN8633501.1 CPBP family intramembrane metalloprotease [Coryn